MILRLLGCSYRRKPHMVLGIIRPFLPSRIPNCKVEPARDLLILQELKARTELLRVDLSEGRMILPRPVVVITRISGHCVGHHEYSSRMYSH